MLICSYICKRVPIQMLIKNRIVVWPYLIALTSTRSTFRQLFTCIRQKPAPTRLDNTTLKTNKIKLNYKSKTSPTAFCICMRLSLHRGKPGISLTWQAEGTGNKIELWAKQLIILSRCVRVEDDWRSMRDTVIVSYTLHRTALFVCILVPGGRTLAPPSQLHHPCRNRKS